MVNRFGQRDAHGAAAAQGLLQDHEPGVRKVEQLPARQLRKSGQTGVSQHVTNKGLVTADYEGFGG
jgi:hypothetical protein